ncbi:Hypothetical predicted protein, partial [Olea europaea subsp. europaea]
MSESSDPHIHLRSNNLPGSLKSLGEAELQTRLVGGESEANLLTKVVPRKGTIGVGFSGLANNYDEALRECRDKEEYTEDSGYYSCRSRGD